MIYECFWRQGCVCSLAWVGSLATKPVRVSCPSFTANESKRIINELLEKMKGRSMTEGSDALYHVCGMRIAFRWYSAVGK